jgi:hypothetical protein
LVAVDPESAAVVVFWGLSDVRAPEPNVAPPFRRGEVGADGAVGLSPPHAAVKAVNMRIAMAAERRMMVRMVVTPVRGN